MLKLIVMQVWIIFLSIRNLIVFYYMFREMIPIIENGLIVSKMENKKSD